MSLFGNGVFSWRSYAYVLALFVPHTIISAHAQGDVLPDIHLGSMRDSEEFRYMRALFPPDSDLAPEDLIVLQRGLAEKLDELLKVYRDNRRSVAAMLNTQGTVVPEGSLSKGPVVLEVVKDDDPVAALTADGRVVISVTTLRGFLVGAFRSGVVDETAEALMFRNALGWKSDPGGDEETWQKRTRAYVDLINAMDHVTVTATEQQAAFADLLGEVATPSPEFFETLRQDVVDGGAQLTPVNAYRLMIAQMQFGAFVHGAEERFLLAHELGHLVLRHAQDAPCDSAGRQERDADAFAIALLSYDFSGGVLSLMMFGGADNSGYQNLYQPVAGEPDMRRTRFGYGQAFRHGMASAGMRADPKSQCVFVPPEERFARTDAFQLAMSQRQFAAYNSFHNYARARPSTAAVLELASQLDPAGKQTFVTANRGKCNGAAVRLVRFTNWNTYAGKPNIYSLKCAWPKPSLVEVPETDRVLIGELYYRMEALYSDTGAKEIENF